MFFVCPATAIPTSFRFCINCSPDNEVLKPPDGFGFGFYVEIENEKPMYHWEGIEYKHLLTIEEALEIRDYWDSVLQRIKELNKTKK